MYDDMQAHVRTMPNSQEIALALLGACAFFSGLYITGTYSEPWPVKEGYYMQGESCRKDSDCKCNLVHGEFDSCGKANARPACVSRRCGWETRQNDASFDRREFDKREEENISEKLFPSAR